MIGFNDHDNEFIGLSRVVKFLVSEMLEMFLSALYQLTKTRHAP
jgi:hypothetical protein